MSSDTALALSLRGVGKMYKRFDSKRDNVLDALSLARLRPWRKVAYHEFWALRGIDLELRHGERVGVIGRNGAGKSTLLKLVTGNLAVTEGSIEVGGTIQALLDAGGGLHPEFTGYENIRASLTYQGLGAEKIAEAEGDIADFTELGDFLDQPFKTYSLGMQTRLAFAISTAISPDILIIDEILGAGDAYFFGKSIARMRGLVDSGASVVIVSHALDQIQRFCAETIWLERGRIVQRGPTVSVLREYERFIRSLEDRRLRRKSERATADRVERIAQDDYEPQILVDLTAPVGSDLSVRRVSLYRGDELEDQLAVGSPQDADRSASSHMGEGDWSCPEGESGDLHRVLRAGTNPAAAAVVFNVWSLSPTADYRVLVEYQATGDGRVEIRSESEVVGQASLPATRSDWRVVTVPFEAGSTIQRPQELARWRGEGRLRIVGVELRDSKGVEKAVYDVGEMPSIHVMIEAAERGAYPVFLAGLLFRLDGVVVCRQVSEEIELKLAKTEDVTAELSLGKAWLGPGYYAVSIGLYRQVDVDDIEPSTFYDYIDRSYEFQVVGAPKMHNELVVDVGSWRITDAQGVAKELEPLWTPDRRDRPPSLRMTRGS
jgi:lipopolysaccharide transport system ATP-binding protein